MCTCHKPTPEHHLTPPFLRADHHGRPPSVSSHSSRIQASKGSCIQVDGSGASARSRIDAATFTVIHNPFIFRRKVSQGARVWRTVCPAMSASTVGEFVL